MDKVVKDFGSFIKERRIEKGLSQEEVAKMLNIRQQTYGRYELGLREPGLWVILELSKILNFAPGEFFDSYNL